MRKIEEFNNSAGVLKYLSVEGIDDVDCLLLNENNLQQGKEETLGLIDDYGYELVSPFECQSRDHLQKMTWRKHTRPSMKKIYQKILKK